jgi:hypothetical protein
VVAAADERRRVEDDFSDLMGAEGVLALQRCLYAVQEVVDLVLVVAAPSQGGAVERHTVDDHRG